MYYTEDRMFNSGDNKEDLITLIDCAYDIMEIWKAEGDYNKSLKKKWLERARQLGAEPSL